MFYLFGTSDRELAEEVLKFVRDSFSEHTFEMKTNGSTFEVMLTASSPTEWIPSNSPVGFAYASKDAVLFTARAFIEGWRKAKKEI